MMARITILPFLTIACTNGFLQSRKHLYPPPCPFTFDGNTGTPIHALFQASGDRKGQEDGQEADPPSSKRRRPIRIRRPSAATEQIETRREEAQARHEEALKDPTLLTKVQFSDRPDIHPSTKRGITEVMGLQRMTEIQAKSYAAALSGASVLGRARTGTGKTLAFLLPVVERLLEADLDLYKPGRNIGAIIVAPTRELAIQIANQAEALLTFHKDMDVACIYGGTKMQRDMRLLSGPRLPTILVATPGRLLEHLDNTKIVRRRFRDIAQETRIVVLDEADRLFEGFAKETKKILSFLPRAEKRQTLLFSATISKRQRGALKESMNTDFTEVDCVNDRDIRTETNLRVDQSYHSLETMEQYIPTLVGIIRQAMKNEDTNCKILVFFPASKLVRFFVNLFNVGLEIPVLEIHSRMSQGSRNRASNAFRTAQRGILFTSDVSARGVDYPDVTLVVQYGAPSTEDGYIHRLGRTGRAGRHGKGLLVLLPFEKKQLKSVRRRGIQQDLESAEWIERAEGQEIQDLLEPARLQIRSGHVLLTPNAEAAYRAFLAYYIAKPDGLGPSKILESANEFAISTGLAALPSIESKVASRLGLEGLVEESS